MPATVTAPGPGMSTMPLASLVSLPPLRKASRTASVRLRLIIAKYTPLRRSSGQPISAPNAAADQRRTAAGRARTDTP